MAVDLLVILCALMASAFFSGMELAFVSASRIKIEIDNQQKGKLKDKVLAYFMSHPSDFIGTMLLGNNIALVIYGIYTARIMDAPLRDMVGDIEWLVLLLQTIISTIVILYTAEFLPKALFSINPNRILSFNAVILFAIYWLLRVLTFVTIGLSNLILKIFRIDTSNAQQAFSKYDLNEFVNDIEERIDEEEEIANEIQILKNALNFKEMKARDCMVPRNEIVALDVDTPVEDLVDQFAETGLSKILIYRDSIDNIIGYVHSYELFKKPEQTKHILLPIGVIPESMLLNDALERLLRSKRSILVVVDEYGGTSGLLTVEDIIEEIIGDIEDEHDVDDTTEEEISEGVYRFSARLEVDYLNENYDFNFKESDEYETIAGYLINQLERIPEKGEIFSFDSWKFEIVEVDGTRILEIEVTKLDS